MATNLEYLKWYAGISLNMENSENHRGKIVTKKISFVRHSNICVKLDGRQATFWTSEVIRVWGAGRGDLFAGIYME